MLTSSAFHRRQGRPWWLGLGLALTWAALPAAPQPASPPAQGPVRQVRSAADATSATTESQGRFLEPDEPVRPVAVKRGPRAALIDFESATLAKDALKAISQALLGRLDVNPDLAMFPRVPTRRWLIRHDLFPFTPYQPPPPPARITAALKADYLITGHLNQVDGVFALDISIYSDRARKYVLKDFKLEKGTEAELLESFAPLGAQLHQAIMGNEAVLRAQNAPSAEVPESEPSAPAIKAQALPPAATIQVEAKPRTEARRPAATKKTRRGNSTSTPRAEATPPPAAKAPRLESDEGEMLPPARSTPAPTPRPTPEPRTTVKATPSPTPTAERVHGAAHKPTPTPAATARPTPAPTAAHATESAHGAEPTAAPTPPANPAQARSLMDQARRSDVTKGERLQLLTKAAGLDPANAEIQQQLAQELYAQGNYEAAITQSDKAAQLLPKAAIFPVIKGSALYELGLYDQSIKANQEALKLDPRNVWASFNLALALAKQTPEQAIAAWRNFITMFGEDPQQKPLVDQARQSLADLEAAAKK